ncbi:L-serine dehydratase, alpha chain [bioreactor metagenome]|uniref:L-serine dehydratase, alpha chain n=1 Tax=bioreactor metagenome TaxID=1076179 RepID=A0A644ZPX7_9ZZZZ
MAFSSVENMLKAAESSSLWEAVLEEDLRDRDSTREDSISRMKNLWTAMVRSVAEYDPAKRSKSGLAGGAAALLSGGEDSLCGPYFREIIETAVKTGECNACMGRIVAAPTAGASGVMPAVLLPYQKKHGTPNEVMVHALYVAAGFGQVIATRASISGAEGGCQAEIGSASAMASAALVFLHGGSPAQMASACALALSNLMGLVCDPVAGLVEVPCIYRNVVGAMSAMSCAELALAGILSAIPCDEVVDAMRAVGDAMPASLRETGNGGLAATPTGRKVAERMENR